MSEDANIDKVKIAYVPHPVAPEQKRKLRNEGFRIVDARFKPEEIGEDDIVVKSDAQNGEVEPTHTPTSVTSQTTQTQENEQDDSEGTDDGGLDEIA